MTKILFHYCGLFNDVIVVGVIVGAVVAKVLGVAVVAFVAEAVVGTGDGGVVFAVFCFALSDVLSAQCCGSLLISMNHDELMLL